VTTDPISDPLFLFYSILATDTFLTPICTHALSEFDLRVTCPWLFAHPFGEQAMKIVYLSRWLYAYTGS